LPTAGSFSFVFHSHIPYARQAGRWPHGEEWLHEAAAETYIPLLNALNDLKERGVQARLTISLTPILVEQLADEDIRRNFSDYLRKKIEAAEEDLPRFQEAGQPHLHYLAGYYRDWYRGILQSFEQRYAGNLVPAFRALQDAGILDILTCAATHAYLPLLSHDESIHLQLRTAVESYKRHFGRPPRGIWLPECAYRPAYFTDQNRERPGLEALLEAHGLSYFFAETHMIEGGLPVGVAAGEVIGPYGAVRRRYVVPFSESRPPQPTTTFQPYYVTDPQVTVLGRENRAGLQVWSAQWGYPGEYDYREFHKKDGRSGLQYWRVTGARVDLGGKDEYHPDWASFKAGQHADHFAHLVESLLQEYRDQSGRHGILCAMYDTELFGHWWFEGVDWIAGVLERLATSEQVELATVGGFLEAHPAETAIHLPEGSWGAGGNHFVWDNADNSWMWPIVHAAEQRMAQAVRKWPEATGGARKALDQAARELVLLQASDWPFMITTGQAREYAITRFQQHVERFENLMSGVERGSPDTDLAQDLWERDKVFPEMDYRWFAR
jgi:1,4-alpha-glucan branching enzyme